jgi:hypothetical protein
MAENYIHTQSETQLRQRLICAGGAGVAVLLINFGFESINDLASIFSHFHHLRNPFYATIAFLALASWKPWFLGMGAIALYTACQWIKGAEVGGRLTLMVASLFLSVILLWCFAGNDLNGHILIVKTGFGVLATIALIWFKARSEKNVAGMTQEEMDIYKDKMHNLRSAFCISCLSLCIIATVFWYQERDLYPEASAILTAKYGPEFRQMKVLSVYQDSNYNFIAFAEKTVKTVNAREERVCFPPKISFLPREGYLNCFVPFVVRNGVFKITGPSIKDTVNRGEANDAVLAVAEGYVDVIREHRKKLDDQITAQNTWRQ